MSDTEVIQPIEEKPPASQELKREIIEFVKIIAWFLVVFFLVKTYVVEGYEVQGPSMIPTLQDRERIMVVKLPHILSQFRVFSGISALKEGDIVVFDSPVETNKRYVKRVIAKGPRQDPRNTVEAEQNREETPGHDSVRVRYDKGKVYINNKRIEESYLTPEQTSDDSPPPVFVKPGGYYVLGDNRGVSKDSRSFGPVDDSRLIGKALFCFWPPSHIRLLQ